jgi:hypothetical protein
MSLRTVARATFSRHKIPRQSRHNPPPTRPFFSEHSRTSFPPLNGEKHRHTHAVVLPCCYTRKNQINQQTIPPFPLLLLLLLLLLLAFQRGEGKRGKTRVAPA